MLSIFVVASVAILVVPGPAVLYITARSVQQGRMAGLVSVLGIHAGVLVHIAAAVVGLSALVVTSALAFSVVKYVGAAYLIYLGVKTFLSPPAQLGEAKIERKELKRLFWDGVVVSIFNPKVGLFFLVFMPQVIDPSLGNIWMQSAIFGVVFVLLGLIVDGGYALLAGSAGQWIKSRRSLGTVQKYVTGTVFLGLGVAAAFGSDGRKG